MSQDHKPIPSPMSAERERVLQRRAEKQLPLTRPSDRLTFERKTLHVRGQIMDLGGIFVKLPDDAKHDAVIEVAIVRDIKFVKPSELALNRPL